MFKFCTQKVVNLPKHVWYLTLASLVLWQSSKANLTNNTQNCFHKYKAVNTHLKLSALLMWFRTQCDHYKCRQLHCVSKFIHFSDNLNFFFPQTLTGILTKPFLIISALRMHFNI